MRQILRALRPLALGVLWALPLGGALALARRSIALYLAANEYRRAVLDHAVDGIILIDDDGSVRAFNPAAEQIFGYRADEVLGQNLRQIVAPPDHVLFKLVSIGREVTGLRSDGTSFPMDMTSGQMQISGRRMYILIARDVTRRQQAEDELRRARDAAEAGSRAKSAFLLTMSHELRTPLNAIIGYGELVREELEERGQADLLPDLLKIDAAGRHLLAQIDGVLELSNLESGALALAPAPFALGPLLDELAAAAAPLLAAGGNALEVACSEGAAAATLTADRARVREVLMHLLSNAAKFTEGGRVQLRADMEDGGVRLAVSDTGVGMAEAQVARLFEPFAVADPTRRRHSGAGLGLAIAQRLCRLMGGEISAASAPGQGSTFTVVLPLEPPARQRGQLNR